ncbi:MAG: glycerate kinase [Nitrospira sp.]|nr:glycerate kinase [Nitrospira sp.]
MPLRFPASPAQSLLRKLIATGLAAANPYHALLKSMSRHGHLLRVGRRTYDLDHIDRIVAVGAGKASARMAQAIEHILGTKLERGFVVVPPGHRVQTRQIAVVEAGHPIPDRAGRQAAQRIQTLIHDLTPRDLLIVLLSGGASSLLPSPAQGITLAAKQRTTRLLLRSGATIEEINVVRKHLSRLKGGGLALSTQATIATLILSDVIGDDIGTIGSGPTAPDPTTFADAISVLRRYKIWLTAPLAVRRHLLRGNRGVVPETLKPGSQRLRSVHHVIIGNNRGMLDAVARAAERAGLYPHCLSDPIVGEARTEAKRFVGRALRLLGQHGQLRRPSCVIAGGEPTVTVTGHGKGGRAQEFAAAAALHLTGVSHVWLAALGTDGTDGPTDVSGAVVNGATAEQAEELGVDLRSALKRHDTYPALRALQCHIRTGPTGTNVNDLYLLLVL